MIIIWESMKCIIKNIPVQTFDITGNTGIGFPLTDYCPVIAQPIDESCYLVYEDGYTEIFTENENWFSVTCVDPIDICYLVLQENKSIIISQQESEDVIFCSEVDRILPETNCYLVLEEDGTTALADVEYRDLFYAQCEQEQCFLTFLSGGVVYTFIDEELGEEIFVDCEDLTEHCYLVLEQDGTTALVDEEYQEGIFFSCNIGDIYHLVSDADGITPIIDQESGDYIIVSCD